MLVWTRPSCCLVTVHVDVLPIVFYLFSFLSRFIILEAKTFWQTHYLKALGTGPNEQTITAAIDKKLLAANCTLAIKSASLYCSATQSFLAATQSSHKRHRSGGGEGVWSWLSKCKTAAGLHLCLYKRECPIGFGQLQFGNPLSTTSDIYTMIGCMDMDTFGFPEPCSGGGGLWLSLCMQMTVWQESARRNT